MSRSCPQRSSGDAALLARATSPACCGADAWLASASAVSARRQSLGARRERELEEQRQRAEKEAEQEARKRAAVEKRKQTLLKKRQASERRDANGKKQSKPGQSPGGSAAVDPIHARLMSNVPKSEQATVNKIINGNGDDVTALRQAVEQRERTEKEQQKMVCAAAPSAAALASHVARRAV